MRHVMLEVRACKRDTAVEHKVKSRVLSIELIHDELENAELLCCVKIIRHRTNCIDCSLSRDDIL